MRYGWSLAALALVVTTASPALADDAASSAIVLERDTPREKVLRHSYWENAGPARPFVSGSIEAGPFVKPTINFGYGKPHWMWAGVEAYPMTTWSFFTGYAGLVGQLPFLNARVGVRETASYDRSFLEPSNRFSGEDVAHLSNGRPMARYEAIEAAARLIAPVPGGYVVGQYTIMDLASAGRGTYVYEENLRVVVKAPIVWSARALYAAEVGRGGFLKFGPVVELLDSPSRQGGLTWRAGAGGQAQLTEHTDVTVGLLLPVSSPDNLGFVEGSFGVLSFKWTWAMNDPHPSFP